MDEISKGVIRQPDFLAIESSLLLDLDMASSFAQQKPPIFVRISAASSLRILFIVLFW